ncbi:MAG: glycosyltransferase family 4 protein [Planctomycetota bacterium]|nr:glycosyltransferase family 4 protein [Planctomycetota bacterium]
MSALRVAVLTNMPTYYQVDLFNAIAANCPQLALRVYYLRKLTPGRQWTVQPNFAHDHVFVRERALSRHFYLSPGLTRELRAFRPDLTVVGQYAGVGMQWTMYRSRLAGAAWVYWSERPGMEWAELPVIRWERMRRLLRWFALLPVRRWPREIWGIGPFACEFYSKISRRPVRNLSYFCDLGRYLSIPRTAPPERPRVLYLGKFVERKGIDQLCQALDALYAKGARFPMDFAGDGPLRPLVTDLAAKYPDLVTYHGFKEIAELPALLGSADALVCPSRYDGWGMTVPEGMASGLAVVASNRTASAVELIRDGENGYTIEPTAEALERRLGALAGDPATCARIGARARESVLPYDARAGAARFAEYALECAKPRS